MDKRAFFPNVVTLGNLFFGFWAIISIGQGNFKAACWLLVVAAICDALDGTVARLVKSNGKMGAMIDSLADVISFGLAPSYLVYRVAFEPLNFWGVLLAFLPLLGGALRLARFMNDKPSHSFFTGLPIPSAALIIGGYYLYTSSGWVSSPDPRAWMWLTPITAILMISPIPYIKPPKVVKYLASKPILGIFVFLVILVSFVLKPGQTLFIGTIVYIVVNPLVWIFRGFYRLNTPLEDCSQQGETNNKRLFRRRRKKA